MDRDLRLGVGFSGLEESSLPVNRGFNRLTFSCSAERTAMAGTIVGRGRDATITVVVEERPVSPARPRHRRLARAAGAHAGGA